MPLPSINKSCYIYNGETGFTACVCARHGLRLCVYVFLCVCVSDCVCQSRARAQRFYIYYIMLCGVDVLSLSS